MSSYKCKQCGARVEKAQSCGCSCSTEEIKCPQCGGTDLEKVSGLEKIQGMMSRIQGG